MRFYINPEGVICWNKDGWPERPTVEITSHVITRIQYEQALSRAKAESVPVREGGMIYGLILDLIDYDAKIKRDSFYDVPDSEINKEWL